MQDAPHFEQNLQFHGAVPTKSLNPQKLEILLWNELDIGEKAILNPILDIFDGNLKKLGKHTQFAIKKVQIIIIQLNLFFKIIQKFFLDLNYLLGDIIYGNNQ